MRILGWLAMAAGVLGIVAGIALATGVWVLRPTIEERAGELLVAAEDGLARATELAVRVDDRLAEVSGRVGDIQATADRIAADPVVDPALRTELATTIDAVVSGPYAALTTGYAALRERAAAVGDAIRALDQAIPAISLPGTGAARLAEIDAELVRIDALLTTIADLATNRLTGPGIAASISEQAAAAEAALVTVDRLLADVSRRLAEADERLADADERVATLLTGGALAATIFGLYLAGLNVLLVRQGRSWLDRRPATGASGGS